MSQALPLITRHGDRIAIVSGLRTPFARQATAFHGIPAVDLGKMVVGRCWLAARSRHRLLSNWFSAVVQMPEAPNIAREIVLGTGMNVHTDAYSVSRACATSFRAVANVAESLMAGTIRAGIAGGAVPHPCCPSVLANSWPASSWMPTKPGPPVRSSNSSRVYVCATSCPCHLPLLNTPPACVWATLPSRWQNLRYYPRTAGCTGASLASARCEGVVGRQTCRRGDDGLHPAFPRTAGGR